MVATRSHVKRRERAQLQSSLAGAVKSLEIARRTGKIGVPIRPESHV